MQTLNNKYAKRLRHVVQIKFNASWDQDLYEECTYLSNVPSYIILEAFSKKTKLSFREFLSENNYEYSDYTEFFIEFIQSIDPNIKMKILPDKHILNL